MFIIHKNGNKTSIQPILKSNSTSFMFKNIFWEMNIKKSYPLGGEGNGKIGKRISTVRLHKSNFLVNLLKDSSSADVKTKYKEIGD